MSPSGIIDGESTGAYGTYRVIVREGEVPYSYRVDVCRHHGHMHTTISPATSCFCILLPRVGGKAWQLCCRDYSVLHVIEDLSSKSLSNPHRVAHVAALPYYYSMMKPVSMRALRSTGLISALVPRSLRRVGVNCISTVVSRKTAISSMAFS